jgi:hypothetical protein
VTLWDVFIFSKVEWGGAETANGSVYGKMVNNGSDKVRLTIWNDRWSFLHRMGMKLPAVVSELAAVEHEDAFDENRVKY